MFPKRDETKPKFKFRRTPPPNYQDRSVKLKLFALVAMLIGILWIAERWSQPGSWDWFWRLETQQEDVKNRLEPKLSRTAHDEPGTIVQTSKPVEEPIVEKPEATEPDAAELAWRQGWKDIYGQLDPTERTLLFEILAQARGEHTLGPAALDQASKLVVKLNENWNAYGESAFQSLAELKPDDRDAWQKVLREVNERWSVSTRPPLEAAAQGVPLQDEQLKAAQAFQKSLDRLALNLIKDDTPLRPNESDIWFRLMTQAQHSSADELAKQSLKGITYLQMFKQSSHYRGDPIRIRGIVRGGWKATAVHNPWNLKDYYVLWIHPQGGPNSPIVVHLPELPAGFPKVNERAQDGSLTKLHEDVVVDAYFFKRQAYLGLDGTYTAPLLIAKTVSWIPENSPDARSAARNLEYSWPVILTMVASALAISLFFVGFMYWRLREQEQHSPHEKMIAAADMSQLQGVELTPSVEEGLKQLEQDYVPRGK
ncbi:hypothetical protein ETAA8_62500 [Anatilimnocola aggregata]|uniref:Uncharacterized protein n=1 Tax=Anatilimnocola aggregata TaxID=2528021 RepID=A0A517YLI7_9BACT|nr:hypothetical protein [Anatilimnocola aggregata]QDU31097.1 hypothetical protein ETAA8_62500 [Anatilimnocola aggregata]